MWKCVSPAVLLLVSSTLSAQPQPPLVVRSQNTLRYGHGDTNPSRFGTPAFNTMKITQIWNSSIAGGQVGLLQEVMQGADMSQFTGCVPGQCLVLPGGNARVFYGRSPSYREASAIFFVLDPLTTWNPTVHECNAIPNAVCTFSRPPATLRLTPPNVATHGVMGFHAIWGNSVQGRETEARLVGQLVALQNMRIIVGGDWNLDAQTVANQVGTVAGCSPNGCVAPNGLTSLNPQGVPSSSYDHFYWTTHFTIANTNVIIPAAVTLAVWRGFSDHLGINGSFQ